MMLSTSAHVDSFTRDNLPPRHEWPHLLFTLPELRYPERLNCAEALLDATVERLGPDRRCLRSDTDVWSYGDVLQRVNQLSHVLVEDLGLVPGNRVLLRGPNTPWLAACWLAVMKAGAVAVTTMPLLRAADLRPVIDASCPSVALCDHRFLAELAPTADRLPVVPFGGDDADGINRLAAGKPPTFDSLPTAADDVCLLAFTSGTTGQPKGTMHFHRDVLAVADTFSARILRPRPDDLFCGSPSLAFTFGLGALLVFPLRAGAATLLLEQTAPHALLAGIGRHRATICSTAPTAYRAMLPELAAVDTSSLRRCVSAGEILPRATWEAFLDATGLRLIDGIGATEMLHIFISAEGADIRPGTVGREVPGYEARVVDDAGRPVPDGEAGHLAVRGPTGCRYLSGVRQRSYVRDGWNLTGDRFVRDGDGYYSCLGRADDLIVSAGYNIAGPEVEEVLLRHPDVADAAVAGVPDARRGTIVKAWVVLRPGADPTPATAAVLQAFVKAQIAPYKYPRAVEFRDALPRTPTGKLQRFRLHKP